MKRVATSLLFAALALGCPNTGRELCNNGVDDDGDGVADCQDFQCAQDPACKNVVTDGGGQDAGYYGSCAKCGQACSTQEPCLQNAWDVDDPLPQCYSGICTRLLEGIRLRFEVDTITWSAVTALPRSMNTRFVLKKAVDGSAVTCEVLKAAASSKAAADASQLERSGKFNLLAYDVAPVQATAGTVITQPFLPTGTGKDFIIWVELWAGPRDSTTKLPTGTRIGWGCFESGAAVEPILTQHHWASGTPTVTSRTIRVDMPPPQ